MGWPPVLLSEGSENVNEKPSCAASTEWPRTFVRFHEAHPKVGQLWAWASPEGTRIYNLLTQEPAPSEKALPGKAKLEHVNHSLRQLRHTTEEEKIASLAIPRIATGHGGLQWADVEPLVEQHLGTLKIPVYVYSKYIRGEKAPE